MTHSILLPFIAYSGFHIRPFRVCSILWWIRIRRRRPPLSTEEWVRREKTLLGYWRVTYFDRFSNTREYISYFPMRYISLSNRSALPAAPVPESSSRLPLYDFRLDTTFCYLIIQTRISYSCTTEVISEPKVKNSPCWRFLLQCLYFCELHSLSTTPGFEDITLEAKIIWKVTATKSLRQLQCQFPHKKLSAYSYNFLWG